MAHMSEPWRFGELQSKAFLDLWVEALGPDGLSGFRASPFHLTLPGPSNEVPFWVCYGCWVRTLIRTTKKVLQNPKP